ncbi:MAG: hypothetical protein GXO94_00010 [Nitrospirae bacterium]|nr:hypothetical protein [Nitrospirota bacterium]
MPALEYRVDTLESLPGQSIVHTDTALRRLEREMRGFEDRTEKMLSEQNRRRGEMANKTGTLVEDMVAPNIPRTAAEVFGCREMDFFAVRVEKRDKKRNISREFDVIAVPCFHPMYLSESAVDFLFKEQGICHGDEW